MNKLLLIFTAVLSSVVAQAQFSLLPYSGSDTSNACTGVLTDHAGNLNYGSSASGFFVIDPPGTSTVSLTFTNFGTYNYYDRVIVYDGVGIYGTIIGSYYGSSIPNSGLPVTSTNGAITVRFYSDSYNVSSGFRCVWSTGNGTAPSASFITSNTTPKFNTPVTFLNTSTNGGDYYWDFGDGNTSTDLDATHLYKSAGLKQVMLIASNCSGVDTATIQNVIVQSSPNGSVSPDTVDIVIPCGTSGTGNLTITNASGGPLDYNLSLDQVTTNGFYAGFENNNLDGFVNQSSSVYTTSYGTTGAPQGNSYLQFTGDGYLNDGLKASFTGSQPEEISYYIKSDYNGYTNGNLEIGDYSGSYFSKIFKSEYYYGTLRLYYGYNTSYTYYNYTTVQGSWYHVELKNINYTAQTFDLYVNNALLVTSAKFFESVSSVNQVELFNYYSGNIGLDGVKIGKNLLSNVSYSPSSGTVNGSNNTSVLISADATDLIAGTYWLNFSVTSNDTAIDGLNVPLKLEVTGTAQHHQSATCLNYGTSYTGFNSMDSVLIWNTGCDTLKFSGITTSSSEVTTSSSSMFIEPSDSAYLMVGLNPVSPGLIQDTVYLVGSDTNTTICVNATAIGSPVIALDSSSYTINYTGCPDSVSFPLTIYNNGLGALNWSASSSALSTISDDFESSTFNTSIWSSWNSGANLTNGCGIISGNGSLNFSGTSGPRQVTTVALNTIGGGIVSFDYAQSTSCDFAESSDGIYLYYSTNNGVSWTQINYYYTSSTATSTVTESIPLGAQGNSVLFKIEQTYPSGSSFDAWRLDNFSITANVNNGIVFSPDTSSIAVGDSISVLATINTVGLTTGVHGFTGNITSNDPNSPIFSFPITLNLQGIPNIVYSTNCVQHDSIIVGNSTMDSVLVYNDGCSDLLISGMTTQLSVFNVLTTTPQTLAPGDSLFVSVSFDPLVMGSYQDSITIANNDSVAKICLSAEGLGAPHAEIDSTLISATINSCSDSIVVPITIKNSGFSELGYEFLGGGSDTIEILAITLGFNTNSYNNAVAALTNHLNVPFNITTFTSSTAASLTAALVDKDVLWIAPSFSNYSSYFTNFAPAVQAYMNAGGNMVVGASYYEYNIFNMGIFSGVDYGYNYSGQSVSVHTPNANHPVLDGIPSTFQNNNYRVYYMNFSNTGKKQLVYKTSSPTYDVVTEVSYGAGEAVYIGFDFQNNYNYGTEGDEIFANSIREYAQNSDLPSWLTLSPDSGAISTGDSIVVNFTFKANEVGSGTYNDTVYLETNEPSNPLIRIPVQFTVNGAPDIDVQTACIPFGSSFVGLSNVDSTMVYNSGCDSLTINTSSDVSGQFSILGLPITIGPNDSLKVPVEFKANVIGLTNDTISVFSNSDTVSICVSGTGLGAPLATTNPDTLKVTLNKCDGFVIENFDLKNTGQGSLTYDLSVGSLYQETSAKNYSSSQSYTQHQFANTPNSADTIFFEIVLNGDFAYSSERIRIYVDNYYLGYFYDNDVPAGTYDTIRFFQTGTNVNTWLADSALNVDVYNYGVTAGIGLDLHQVTVTIKSTPSWITLLSGISGSASAGSTKSKSAMLLANGLPVGTYNSNVIVESNDPVTPVYLMPVVFEVVDKPSANLGFNCINYFLVKNTNPIVDSVLIYNDGCQNLVISNLSFSNADFTSTMSNATVQPDDSLWIPVTFTPSVVGNINSSLIIYNNDSNLTVCLQAQVVFQPIVNFDKNVTDMCNGTVSLSDNTSNMPISWAWSFGDGNTSSIQHPNPTYTKPGVYNIELIATNASGSDTLSQIINMSDVLFVGFGAPDSIVAGVQAQFYDSSMVATSWNWYFGDGGNSTLQNPTHTYTTPGTYYISYNVTNATCNKTINKQIVVYSGIGLEEDLLNEIKIFPVPSSDYVNITWDKRLSLTDLTIVDASGKTVGVQKIDGATKYKINASAFAEGLYMVKLEDAEGHMVIKKFIIER